MLKSKERKLQALTEKMAKFLKCVSIDFYLYNSDAAADKCQKQNTNLPQAFF